uniref:Protein cueball n=1 Tax=Lygus hesperus TaxID=30085 RepID=A0A0A9XS19_LYGHE
MPGTANVKMFWILLSLLTTASAEWDVVISEFDFLDFLYSDGRNVSVVQGSHRGGVNSLAYDPIYENLYFSDTSDVHVTHIKIMEVTREAVVSPAYSVVSINSSNLYFRDLAHDPVNSSLFWTTTDIPYTAGQIWQATLDKPITFSPLLRLEGQIPQGIVVDSCRGYIYWANMNQTSPSIERLRLGGLGTGPESFITNQIFSPSDLALSQNQRMLYWIDEKTSSKNSIIARAALDGGEVEEFLEFKDGHVPKSLAVTNEGLYFTEESNAVYVVYFSDPVKTLHKLNHTVYNPQGIAVRNQLAFLNQNKDSCPPLAELRERVPPRRNITVCLFGKISPPVNGIECTCWAGYTGRHCEIDMCHNFCLNGERCFLTDGHPTCDCAPDRTGSRCELESCVGTCLNGGTLKCNKTASSQPICVCPKGFYGPSCETPSALCELYCRYGEGSLVPNLFQCPCSLSDAPLVPGRFSTHVTIGLLCAVALAILLAALLFVQTKRLKSRPKIFKRYSVTPKPVTSPSCEIAIENCCNMNICDTPCYEPDLRTLETDRKKSKKEEKRGLLSEDVLAQNSCRSVPDF